MKKSDLCSRIMEIAAADVINSKTMTVAEAASKYCVDQAILVNHIPEKHRRIAKI